jgi:S1-C subfamily serine protease
VKVTIEILVVFVLANFLNLAGFGQCLDSEQEYENYYQKNFENLDLLEGIWLVEMSIRTFDRNNNLRNEKIMPNSGKTWFIIKSPQGFERCPYGGTSNNPAIFIPIAKNKYLFRQYSEDEISEANVFITSPELIEYSYKPPYNDVVKYIGEKLAVQIYFVVDTKMVKIFPTAEDIVKSTPSSVSGSGFAISSDGIIATNYHVIEGATTIKVKGINGDYTNSITAKTLIIDKINDLALIKVDDYSCKNLGEIPYTIKNQNSKVGENIFVLGYPLRSTMGNEIKLTNGIISSNKGFQDDVSSFQISAPIQPGNSGCPLFNTKGDLIGIINAKHIGAENASYAIKSNYLVSLVNSLLEPPRVNSQSTLVGKSLTSQVEILKKFVYIIECE